MNMRTHKLKLAALSLGLLVAIFALSLVFDPMIIYYNHVLRNSELLRQLRPYAIQNPDFALHCTTVKLIASIRVVDICFDTDQEMQNYSLKEYIVTKR